ncbi:MAG: hypothetical protein ABIZ80_12215 [Bryobacteraceae bacterium]
MKQLQVTFLLCLIAGLSLPGADKKKPKPAEVLVVEATARRDGDVIKMDGRIRNSGEKPIQGLILSFDFFAPGKTPLTTQKGAVDDEIIEPGKEASFRMELGDIGRAVSFKINAFDEGGRDLKVTNPGPFPIE